MYYWAVPGCPWQSTQVAGADTTMASSAPSVFVRPDGEADIVVVGPDNTLMYYWGAPGSSWRSAQVAAARKAFFATSIVVRSDGEAAVVAQGPDDTLLYCWAAPGSVWSSTQISQPPRPHGSDTP